jgi:hypothetical protein
MQFTTHLALPFLAFCGLKDNRKSDGSCPSESAIIFSHNSVDSGEKQSLPQLEAFRFAGKPFPNREIGSDLHDFNRGIPEFGVPKDHSILLVQEDNIRMFCASEMRQQLIPRCIRFGECDPTTVIASVFVNPVEVKQSNLTTHLILFLRISARRCRVVNPTEVVYRKTKEFFSNHRASRVTTLQHGAEKPMVSHGPPPL